MEKFMVKVGENAKLFFFTDNEKVIRKLREETSLTKTIPGEIVYIGECDEVDEASNYIKVTDSLYNNVKIDKENNTADIMVVSGCLFFPDLVYLAMSMFANIYQRYNSYFIQSSVLKYDDKHSIMILGDPNSGKSSMAYGLMDGYGYDLISNDNVLINGTKTICGTKDMQMRLGSIKQNFPELLEHIEIPKDHLEHNDWNIKVYINDYLKANNFGYADDSIITDIYNISTFDSNISYISSREKIDEYLKMYEELTKQIRSNRYVLVGLDYPIPSFEDEKYAQARYQMAKTIVNSASFHDAKGSVKSLTKRIGDIHGKK